MSHDTMGQKHTSLGHQSGRFPAVDTKSMGSGRGANSSKHPQGHSTKASHPAVASHPHSNSQPELLVPCLTCSIVTCPTDSSEENQVFL